MLENFGAGVVVEAPLVSVELPRAGVAQEYAKLFAQGVEGLTQLGGVGKGAVIARFAVGPVACEPEAG